MGSERVGGSKVWRLDYLCPLGRGRLLLGERRLNIGHLSTGHHSCRG